MVTEMADGTAVVVVVKDEKDFLLPESILGLHGSMLPSFLTKIFEVVEEVETDGIISWSMERNSFVVWDPYRLSSDLLPRYFKHGNFSSFIRQLQPYIWFRKGFPDKWEFAHENFLSGQKHLLKDIKRKRYVGQSPQHNVGAGGSFELGPETGFCAELGRFGFETELDKMKGTTAFILRCGVGSGGKDFGVISDVFLEDFLDIGTEGGDQPEVVVEVEHQAAYQYDLIDVMEMVDDLVYISSGL